MGRDRIPVHSIQEMLSGGDLRSIGRVPEVLAVMEKNPERMNELVRCLESGDPVVRSRAADALEKLTARRPDLLKPFKEVLLREAGVSVQQEVRWHMAQMLPRLPLTRRQIRTSFRSSGATCGSQRHRTGVRVAGDVRTVAQGPLVAWSREGVGGSLLPDGGSRVARKGAEVALMLKEEPDGL